MVNKKDAAARVVSLLHHTLFDISKGRLGGKAFGMPVVKLTTTGWKSGEPRITMLTSPVHDDRRVIVVASYGGDDRHPNWYRNLTADPNVKVTMNGRERPMVARTASAGEKAELWPEIVSAYKGYRGYQQKTDRDIPVVMLEPVRGP